MTEATAPAVIPPTTPAVDLATLIGDRASPSVLIMLNDKLFDRCTQIAVRMSRAEGSTPKHLINQAEACFAVVCQSMTWKLDPFAVARCTYQTPGGQLGFFGSLCQAILENSGRIKGQIIFEHFGEWEKIQGKFKKQTSQKGHEYAVRDWTDKDEEGLGVIVRAQVIGEAEPRSFRFLLKQAFPRNSTLWATDPMTQICYTAIRRFGSVAAPAIFMGVPFDREEIADAGTMIDVTPQAQEVKRPAKPTANAVKKESKAMDDQFKDTVRADTKPKPKETVIEETGEVVEEVEVTDEGAGGSAETDREPVTTAENTPHQVEESERAEEEPEREKAKPAQQTKPVEAAKTKAPEPPAADAKPAVPEMTEQEAKAFRRNTEKEIVKFTGSSVTFAAYKDKIMPDYKRLKAYDAEAAKAISEMFANKMKAIKEREKTEDGMED